MALPEISKMLTLSTGHVSRKTISALEDESEMNTNGLAVYNKGGYGFIIYISKPTCRTLEGGSSSYGFDQIPDDLQGLLQYAHDLNCDILCLDADGPRIPYLTWYADETKPDTALLDNLSEEKSDALNLFSLVIRDSSQSVDTIVEMFYTKLPNAEEALAATKRAVQDYLKTPCGKREYVYNNHDFNWGDVLNSIPESFFENEGLFHITAGNAFCKSFDAEVEHDENLGSALCNDD